MEWGYRGVNGPESWHNLFEAANGTHQSPIDIQRSKLKVSTSVSKDRLKLDYNSKMTKLINTGHSWQLQAQDSSVSEIRGGPLTSNYELSQIHAHWGEEDTRGSEHTIDGKYFSGEVHFVHWNKSSYKNIEEANKHPDGLCVLALLLKLGNPNPELQKIVNQIPEILHKSDAVKLHDPINPKMLLPKKFGYWSYMGSLTTPPCYECVVWIVVNDPVEVSPEQLKAFRTLRCHPADCCVNKDNQTCEDRLQHNFRPTCPLGDRIIIRAGCGTKT